MYAIVDELGTTQEDGDYWDGTPDKGGSVGKYVYYLRTDLTMDDFTWTGEAVGEADPKWKVVPTPYSQPNRLDITVKYDGTPRNHKYKWIGTKK